MVDLNTIITNDNKSIKDLISQILTTILTDRKVADAVKARIQQLLTESDEELSAHSAIGALEKDYVNIQSQNTKNMIELLKVVAKLSEPDKAVQGIGVSGGKSVSNFEDLQKMADEIGDDVDIEEEIRRAEVTGQMLLNAQMSKLKV